MVHLVLEQTPGSERGVVIALVDALSQSADRDEPVRSCAAPAVPAATAEQGLVWPRWRRRHVGRRGQCYNRNAVSTGSLHKAQPARARLDRRGHEATVDEGRRMEQDIFARMGDVELLAEPRRIVTQAGRQGDASTGARAGWLFTAFYRCRLQRHVPDQVWTDTGTFVRQHPG